MAPQYELVVDGADTAAYNHRCCSFQIRRFPLIIAITLLFMTYVLVYGSGSDLYPTRAVPPMKVKPKLDPIPIPEESSSHKSQEAIHVVLVVYDDLETADVKISSCTRIETLLKSILTFYDGPLHLHVLVNERSDVILSTLFLTWPIRKFRWNLYHIEKLKDNYMWIKSGHRVAKYDQVKAALHEMLPDYVDKVVLMDTDMLFLEDIRVLHSHFDEMEEQGAMFAIAPDLEEKKNLNDLFKKKDVNQNSGLVLLNLREMRAGNWSGLATEAALKMLNAFGRLPSPQNIFSAIAADHSDKALLLSYYYNFQLAGIAPSYYKSKNSNDLTKVKVPHWTNSPKFHDSGYSHEFLPLFRCMEKVDGYSFQDIEKQPRTLINLRIVGENVGKDDVVLATYIIYDGSMDAIRRMNTVWPGPISLVVYGTELERIALTDALISEKLKESFDIHYVYKRPNSSVPTQYLRKKSVDLARGNRIFHAEGAANLEISPDVYKKLQNNKVSIVRNSDNTSAIGAVMEKLDLQRIIMEGLSFESGAQKLNLATSTLDINSRSPEQPKFLIGSRYTYPDDVYCTKEIDKRR